MATTPFIRRLWKVLGLFGASAASTFLLQNLHIFDSSTHINGGTGNGTSSIIINSGTGNTIGNTFNIKVDNTTLYKEGDIINLNQHNVIKTNLHVVKVNPNDSSITVHVDIPTQLENNNKSNILKQEATLFGNSTVTEFFVEDSPAQSERFIMPPQDDTNWNFLPTVNTYGEAGSLGLKLMPLGGKTFYGNSSSSPMFFSPVTVPLTQRNSDTSVGSGENKSSNTTVNPVKSEGFGSILASWGSSLGEFFENKVSSQSGACPAN